MRLSERIVKLRKVMDNNDLIRTKNLYTPGVY